MAQEKKWLDTSLSFEERAQALADAMTLEEKVFQTLHRSAAIPRLGVPEYTWWNEALHGVARAGVATVFPQAIGLAASFDEDMLEKVGDVISTEGRGMYNAHRKYEDRDIYKGLTFWSPNVNIFRDPRWGRGHETYGEDPYLTSRLGVRFIEGMQGHDKKYMKVAACAKHFAVHSGPEEMRHHFDAVVSKKDLWETYLPAFKACVLEAGVEAVMGAYNRTNGEPCCGSRTLLGDILRKKWGFKGHVTSDCWALKDFHEGHMVTNTEEESVALAMNEGCDTNCGNLNVHLLGAVEKGLVTEETITKAVVRLFTTRMKLGMFDPEEAVEYNKIGYEAVDTKENKEFNRAVSAKTITLLRNENNILPLKKEELKTIAVIGPNANNRKALVGNYEGTASEYVTISEGIQRAVGNSVRVRFSEGCHLFKDRVSGLGNRNDRISEVKGIIDESDAIVLCMGLDPGLEGEEGDQGNEFASGDKPNCKLPGIQEELIKTVVEHAKGKKVILVVLGGSAINLSWESENIDGIIYGFYPGAQGGNAIADILFGKKSPEGKLPITIYATDEELPEFTDYAMKNRTYRYMQNDALYPFGFGLSYTDFKLTVDKFDVTKGAKSVKAKITASLTNTGKMKGAQTVQVYVKANDVEGAPNFQMKGLKKVTLSAGQTKQVTITLPTTAFALYDDEGRLVLNKGDYTVFVGTNAPDKRSVSLGNKVESFKVTVAETKVIEK
ncbi:MAG: glycoside hydrolase family 3 C-terminal domain-containing protein [Lachnospiraceae bacterium]|nr:glycoside hydrolase family 3 C-terminal domain-containing protein [Lachnospiraceae bacterium]